MALHLLLLVFGGEGAEELEVGLRLVKQVFNLKSTRENLVLSTCLLTQTYMEELELSQSGFKTGLLSKGRVRVFFVLLTKLCFFPPPSGPTSLN